MCYSSLILHFLSSFFLLFVVVARSLFSFVLLVVVVEI